MGQYTDSLVIALSVLFNTIFGFGEEVKVSKVFDKLHSAIKTTTTVIREGHKKEILQEELVVGDLMDLKSGEKIPADGRLIFSENLQVSEAVLNGESKVSEKNIKKLPADLNLADRENMIYMGSLIEAGKGLALVTSVGKQSEVGNIADLINDIRELKSPLQKKIAKLGNMIGMLIVFLVGV
jgi:Ca2+-transporting ATPase